MDDSRSAPVRVCIFGAAPEAEWLEGVRRSTTAAAATIEVLADARDAHNALRAAAAKHPGDDLILLRAGTALPPLWFARLTRALALPDVLVASPLDNTGSARAPLPAGFTSEAAPAVIDAACYAHGRRETIDWPEFSPLLSAWRGAALRDVPLEKIQKYTLPSLLAPKRCVLVDDLYVADPAQPLRGSQPVAPGADPVPPSALGELREAVAAALAQTQPDFYPGLDAKPVVLHILHGWGGGAERFVRDLAAADRSRHHLVLCARGNFDRHRFGEVLELHDGTIAQPPLRRVHLPNPIASTSFGDATYRAFLDAIIRDYGVDAVMVSSLIGHSLDALRTGLPTVSIGHDYYPLWPLLHRDFGDAALAFDAAQRANDLAGAGAHFEFAERDADFWRDLRDAYVAALIAARAQLVAPSASMRANLLRLAPELAALPSRVIAHGLRPLPAAPAWNPPPRSRLRLLVPGRVRRGKGAQLLRTVLPALREHAEVFLLGAGAEGMEFFGQRDVHVVLNYARDELPQLVARIAPDAALLLATVAETFSYTLSELNALGVPAIATRLGALAERIHDGVDGFLAAPQPNAILATIARLNRDRSALATARDNLRKIPQRTLADVTAEYRELLPNASRARKHAITASTPDRLACAALADELGASRRDADALRGKIAEQQHELEKRADWAIGLDTQLKRTSAALQQLRGEFDERSAWAQRLDAELQDTRRERDELRGERELILRSLSWRITKPFRYAMRKLRALRTRAAFVANRTRAAVHRTRGSVASRGFVGTLRRAADEFRRKPAVATATPVAAPSEVFAPFAVPTSASPRVSIVVPVYNKFAYTAACLRSLAEHAGAAPFEVIVVDDCSSDATPKRLIEIGGIRVVRNAQNLGFIGTCNAGAQQAQGEFVVFLNNDTIVTAGWLDALLRCFDEEPDAGLVGAKLVYPDGRLQECGGIVFSDGAGWNYGRFDDPADPRYGFRREADYVSGAAIMLRRDLFEKLGGFDTRYAPAYYEDTDLAFAVRAGGKKVFIEPRSVVVHFEGITSGTDITGGIKQHQVTNRVKFVEKWKDALARQPARIHEAALAESAANWRARGHVLIVDAYTPTPDQDSGSLRMVNLMRLLRESGYRVSFMPDNYAHMGKYTENLQALGVEALYHPFVPNPLAWLRTHGRGLDAIVLSRHYVATNYVGLARLYAPQAKLIFDTVDLHYLREQRAAALDGSADLARQAARTRTQELKIMRECDVTLVVSEAERELLARDAPGVRVEVLSNVHEVYGRRRGYAQRRDLVFVGGFQHPPNIDAVLWFVREVFPQVRAALPDVQCHIIGSKAPPQITQLAHDGVIVHGYVEDLTPFMDGCRLSIAPLRYGAGVKGKVNMAMSYGLPVVATPCAVEGMHVCADEDVLVAESPADFAEATVRGYSDAALWLKLSDSGLKNVSTHFSFDAARAALARIAPARRT